MDQQTSTFPTGRILETYDSRFRFFQVPKPFGSITSSKFVQTPGQAYTSVMNFSLTVGTTTPGHEQLFDVKVNNGKAGWVSIYSPRIRVVDVPDYTSSVSCNKDHLLVGEHAKCSVETRCSGTAVATISSAVHVVAGVDAQASPLEATGKRKDIGNVFEFKITRVSRSVNITASSFGVMVGLTLEEAVSLKVPSLQFVAPDQSDLFSQAKESVFRRNFPVAVKLLKKALKQDPGAEGRILPLRAQLLAILGSYDRALEDYRRLSSSGSREIKRLSEEIEYTKRLKTRAMQAHAMQQYAQTVNIASEVLKVGKEDRFTHLLRADAALQLGLLTVIC